MFRKLGPLLLLTAALSACAERAWMVVPARIDLAQYPRIGLVDLEGPGPDLAQRATAEFQHRLLEARPGVRLFELGDVQATDPEGACSLARDRQLDAVFVGEVEFSKVSTSVGLTSSLVGVQARSELEGTLRVRLLDAQSGATVWVGSAGRSATVASAGLDTNGSGGVDVADVDATRSAMIGILAQEITEDFRDHWLRRKVEDIPPGYEVTYSDGEEVYAPPRAR